MEAKKSRQILKQYLLGNARDEEAAAVDNWYQSFEKEAPVSLSDEERAAVKQAIWEQIAPVVEAAPARVVPLFRKAAVWAAAVVGLGLLLVWINHRYGSQPRPLAFTTITTRNGERKTVLLKDSTRLTLNAGTTLRVADDFSSARTIDLVDGEVFFDVRHDTRHPFVIHSGDLTVSVLGTSFNISAYSGLKNLSVGVVSGRVKVARDTATLNILQQAQELIYNKERHTYKTVATDASLLAWQDGRLLLNDVSFDEMSYLMKKNFGVEVLTNDDQIRATQYTTELSTSMQPDQAVEVLAAIHNLKIKKLNNQLYLYK